jgi:hypothetical protein
MLKKSFFKTIPFFLFIVLLNSCDKEYNVIGEDLVGDGTFNVAKYEPSVVAYNQKIGPIQSNNLEINALGIYDNPSFGTTTAIFNTQLALAVENPTIDVATAKIKSVVLTIPYFYDKTKTVTNTDGTHTYVLDSIYGPENAKIKLSIYKSNYYMRSLDPADQFVSPQKYYNNQNSVFYDAKVGTAEGKPLNNDSSPTQNTEFVFSPAEYPVETTNSSGVKTTTLKPPAMHLNLDNKFFQDNILNAPAGSLSTNDLFKDYFRGLYFNVESSGSNPGNLNMINFKTGNIVITYEETVVTSGVSAQVEKSIILNMSGNTVSLLNQSNTNANYAYATNPANINTVAGDLDLYLKGGEGSMAIMDLFGAGELEMMRANKYLINQASLTFHVNSVVMGTSYVPQRVYLYDFTKNTPIYDVGGVLSKATAANGGGFYYKFIITNYIRNLINKADATNDKLGLVVAEKVSSNIFYALQAPNIDPVFSYVPMTSVMNPLGVILYGSNAAVPADKRAKFEIYYTKPN